MTTTTTTTTTRTPTTANATTTTASPYYGNMQGIYVNVPSTNGGGWFNWYNLGGNNGYVLARYARTPQLYNFQNGIFSYVASDGTVWYVDADASNNITFKTTTPTAGEFVWSKNGAIQHVASGLTLQLGASLDSDSLRIQLGSVTSQGELFKAQIAQPIAKYTNSSGNYTDIPGPIYIATTGFNTSPRAWFNPYQGVSEGSQLCCYSVEPTQFMYQGKKILLQSGSITYYLKCNTTSPSNITFSQSSNDTFTWSKQTGILKHDQSGLNLEYIQPNGADNSFMVLHDPNRQNISNNTPWIPEYAFDV